MNEHCPSLKTRNNTKQITTTNEQNTKFANFVIIPRAVTVSIF